MSRSVLVLNSGSSSLKYALYKFGSSAMLTVQGLVEYIGTPKSILHHSELETGKSVDEKQEFEDHKAALRRVVDLMELKSDSSSLNAVGHRVVHGGEEMSAPSLITPEVKRILEKYTPLAPLHNPPNLQGIRVAEELFTCPQVAVFDTGFHSTLPQYAYTYGIPYHLYQEYGIRKYGFHGTSYTYLLRQTAKMLSKPVSEVNMIALHLGAGASMAVIREGKCIDTTMGVTPLEGLVMATRCGDIDPAVYNILHNLRGLSCSQIDNTLNKESGIYGICGEKDMKTVVEKAAAGEERYKLALDVYVHRVRKYLGAYLLQLRGKCDAIVFSAGIGERSAPIRGMICSDLEAFGIALDSVKNDEYRKDAREVQAPDSAIKVMVIPTDEELCIAQETLRVLDSLEPMKS